MKENISITMKKNITKDWIKLYPYMGIYKPMWLMNILGPLVVGVLLHIKSDKDRYIPTLHFHNLAQEFPVVSLGIEITDNNNYVSTVSRKEKYKDIANSLILKSPVPLEGDVELKLLLNNLKRHSNILPDIYKLEVFKYMLYIVGWCGKKEIIDDIKKYIQNEIFKFKVDILEKKGGLNNWFNELEESTKNTEKLRRIADEQIIKLKLNKLPVRKIIY